MLLANYFNFQNIIHQLAISVLSHYYIHNYRCISHLILHTSLHTPDMLVGKIASREQFDCYVEQTSKNQ